MNTKQIVGWGRVAVEQTWETLDSGPAIVRVVDAGVEYHQPPLEESVYPAWRVSPHDPQQFEVELIRAPDNFRSLDDLCAALRPRWPQLRQKGNFTTPAEIGQLRRLVELLLSAVEQLHAQGCGVGMLTPGNVLLDDREQPHQLLLADLGFVWRPESLTGRPSWLTSHDDPARKLWVSPPENQQWRGVAVQPDEFDPQPDLIVLSRVFATALLGQVCAAVPHPTPQNGANVPVWKTLDKGMKGEFKTVGAFRAALEVTPLEQHFLGSRGGVAPEPPPPDKPSWIKRAAMAALAIAAIVCVGFFAMGGTMEGAVQQARAWLGGQPTEPVNDPDPEPDADLLATMETVIQEGVSTEAPPAPLPESSSHKAAADRLLGDLASKPSLEDIREIHAAPLSDDPDVRRQEAEWAVYARRRYLDAFYQESREWLEDAETVSNRELLFEKIQAAHEDLSALKEIETCETLTREEDQCVEYFRTLAEQLGLSLS